jgi:acid phosphatase class B
MRIRFETDLHEHDERMVPHFWLRVLHSYMQKSPSRLYDDRFYQWLSIEHDIRVIRQGDPPIIVGVDVDEAVLLMLLLKFTKVDDN